MMYVNQYMFIFLFWNKILIKVSPVFLVMSKDAYLWNLPVYISRVVYTRHRTLWNSKIKNSKYIFPESLELHLQGFFELKKLISFKSKIFISLLLYTPPFNTRHSHR